MIMVDERFESTRENFAKFINQLQPKTKALLRKLERIQIKLYIENVSLLFNQTFLNEKILPNHARARAHTHTHTHTHIYIYICIYINISPATDF